MGAQHEPCGSWRAVREYEGTASEVVWCARYEGPCPWPETKEAGDRLCADSPTRRIRVTWAESAVQDAYDTVRDIWVALADEAGTADLNRSHEQALAIAKDALVACGAEELSLDGPFS